MAKLNVVTVLDQLKQENFVPHPYWGLKCNRGLWLTRFPLEAMPKNPNFMMAFIEAGGNLDAMGHYGETPESLREKDEAGWSLQQVRLLAKGVPAEFCGVVGLDETNWEVYQKGFKRAEALTKMGIDFGCSIWTLGRMPLFKFLKRLFSRGFRMTGYGQINGYIAYHPAVEWVNSEGLETKRPEHLMCEELKTTEVGEVLPEKFLAYVRRCSQSSRQRYYTKAKTFVFSSLKAAKIFVGKISENIEKCYDQKYKFSLDRMDYSHTSKGIIYVVHSKLVFLWKRDWNDGAYTEDRISTHCVRVVAGFNVCKIDHMWLLWKVGENISSHLEYTGDLKSAIGMAEKREKKNSPILTLNDVRNDRSGTAGFCLTGVKGFLENRMPHVYRLIKPYTFWAEVPEEIMKIEWSLANAREIFNGYPSPVSFS
jgi:hypothetical protein